MKLIIDIPEEDYKNGTLVNYFNCYSKQLDEIIYNGTLLPKGHGRLIDAEKLKQDYPHNTDWDYPVNTNSYVVESIDNAPTIIEADKGE